MTDEHIKKIIDKAFRDVDVLVKEVQEEKRKEREATALQPTLQEKNIKRQKEKTKV